MVMARSSIHSPSKRMTSSSHSPKPNSHSPFKKKGKFAQDVIIARTSYRRCRQNKFDARVKFEAEGWSLISPCEFSIKDKFFKENFDRCELQYNSTFPRKPSPLSCLFAVFPPELIIQVVDFYDQGKGEIKFPVTLREYFLLISVKILVSCSVRFLLFHSHSYFHHSYALKIQPSRSQKLLITSLFPLTYLSSLLLLRR